MSALPASVSRYPIRTPLVTDGRRHITNIADVVRLTTLNPLTGPGTASHCTRNSFGLIGVLTELLKQQLSGIPSDQSHM